MTKYRIVVVVALFMRKDLISIASDEIYKPASSSSGGMAYRISDPDMMTPTATSRRWIKAGTGAGAGNISRHMVVVKLVLNSANRFVSTSQHETVDRRL
jgi:hypothetical protein